MDFLSRLNSLLKERSINITDLANMTGLPRSTISSYINRKSNPSIIQLKLLADCFNVSIDYLVGREDDFGNVTVAGAGAELTSEEQTLLSCYRVMTEAEKRAVLDTAKAFAERTSTKNKWA